MGLEADCAVREGGRRSLGKARLEEKDLYFKGSFNLKIPFADIQSVVVSEDELEVNFGSGQAFFELGRETAEKWRLKILYPRKLLDKLGVKPGQQISLSGISDDRFIKQLEARVGTVSSKPLPQSDLIFLLAEEREILHEMPRLRRLLLPHGAIWTLWPKGQQHIKEDHVRKAALSCGLVDVKVVSFSERLSGLKLMIPRDQRA